MKNSAKKWKTFIKKMENTFIKKDDRNTFIKKISQKFYFTK